MAVGGGRVGDDVQAAGLGELDGVPADGPGRAGDRYCLAWPQGEEVEGEAGGRPVIGRVAAWASLARAGALAADWAGTATCWA